MMNPWISTSRPLYERIAWVTPKFALIESTSWAKVSRGASSARATNPSGLIAAQRLKASIAWHAPGTRLRQRGKVLRDLCPICEQRGQQSGERPQHDDAREDEGLERADGKWVLDQYASRREERRPDGGDAVAPEDAGDAADDSERRRLCEHDAHDCCPSRAQSAHRGDLALAFEGGAVHRHEYVEQDDDGDDRQARRERLLHHAEQIEDRQQHCAREDPLGLARDVQLSMESWQVRHAFCSEEHGGQRLDLELACNLVHPPEACEREEDGAVVGAPRGSKDPDD